MNRVERVMSVLEGRMPDRPPVSFWYHFPPHQVSGRAAIDAHLQHVARWDLDFLKVMNDNGYPQANRIGHVRDLASLEVLEGDEPEFARQLDVVASLKQELADRVLMTTTVFNAWATLRRMVKGPTTSHLPPNMEGAADTGSATLLRFYREDPTALRAGLRIISESLSNFASACIKAGADGIYMSVREDWLGRDQVAQDLYDELIRDCDLRILSATQAAPFNMLHVCGHPVHLRRFSDYPIQAINWADRGAGPPIRDVCGWMRPAICAGADNLATLPNGTADACAGEVANAIEQAGSRPIMIAPGCTYNPDVVPPENLEALRRSVERTG